jgi:hypothetical protein
MEGAGQLIATLKIDHPWGIAANIDFKSALKKLPMLSFLSEL